MQRLKKSLGERIGHAVLFEVIALGVCAPLFSWLMGTSLFEMGALTLAISQPIFFTSANCDACDQAKKFLDDCIRFLCRSPQTSNRCQPCAPNV